MNECLSMLSVADPGFPRGGGNNGETTYYLAKFEPKNAPRPLGSANRSTPHFTCCRLSVIRDKFASGKLSNPPFFWFVLKAIYNLIPDPVRTKFITVLQKFH